MKMSMTYKYTLTFSLFFCYFVYGVNFYVVGPTLIELAGLFQTTIERICLIYTVRSAGYTCGSLSGFCFKYINRQLIFVFFLTLMGVTLAFMPHCSSLTQLFILAGINGFSIGTFDTAINVWILEIWAEDSGPFMQALHFTYGIGSFVAPLICEPFLSTESVHTGSHGIPHNLDPSPITSTPSSIVPSTLFLNSLNSTTAATTTGSPSLLGNASLALAGLFSNLTESFEGLSFFNSLNQTELDGLDLSAIDPAVELLIYIPYAIAGGVTVLGAMLILVLYYYKPYVPPSSNKSNKSYEMKPVGENGQEVSESFRAYIVRKSPPCLTIWLVSMGSLFLTLFVGMEQMHLQFLPTFAVNTELDLSPSTAAMMSSAAALAFTIGRCLSIPLAIKLRPQTILYTNHLLMFVGTIILAMYANTSETMLWVGNAVLGLGFSSVYASIYAFLENQIRVTNRVGAIFVFAGGLTAAVSPSLVGQYIEASPLILVWFNLVCCLLCFTILTVIHLTVYLNRHKPSKKIYSKTDDGGYGRDHDKQLSHLMEIVPSHARLAAAQEEDEDEQGVEKIVLPA